jgi:hypothetical protein
MDSPATLVVAIAFAVALFGAGVSIAYFVGRKGGIASLPPRDERKLPDRYARELEQCLKLGGDATRDADLLAAIVASQKPAVTQQVATAVEQFIKTSKGLTDRVKQIGADAQLRAPQSDPLADAASDEVATDGAAASSAEQAAAASQLAPDCITQGDVDAAPGNEGPLAPSPFDDARQFKRSNFRGAVKATIYPREAGPGREPVHCTVLTRDLSCGGIGIAHTEQLFPKQIIVIDAVGKLLVGEVRWCRREDDNFYVAGCRLVKTSV